MVTAGVQYLIARTMVCPDDPGDSASGGHYRGDMLVMAGFAAGADRHQTRAGLFHHGQIGYMFLGAGVQAWDGDFSPDDARLLFKALLFPASGSVIGSGLPSRTEHL